MRVGNFAISALVGSTQTITMLWPMGNFLSGVRVGPRWTPIGSHTDCCVPSPTHHEGMPLKILSFLATFWVCQITSFGTPISAAHVINWC